MDCPEPPSLEILKSQLDMGSQFWVTLLEQGVGTDDLYMSLPTSTNL